MVFYAIIRYIELLVNKIKILVIEKKVLCVEIKYPNLNSKNYKVI